MGQFGLTAIALVGRLGNLKRYPQPQLLQHSPLTGVSLFKENNYRKPPRALSFAEEQKLLLCCDLRLRTNVITLLDTGMRIGIEPLRLKCSSG
jgi:hypothetical protein